MAGSMAAITMGRAADSAYLGKMDLLNTCSIVFAGTTTLFMNLLLTTAPS
jgi:hypothetical protein